MASLSITPPLIWPDLLSLLTLGIVFFAAGILRGFLANGPSKASKTFLAFGVIETAVYSVTILFTYAYKVTVGAANGILYFVLPLIVTLVSFFAWTACNWLANGNSQGRCENGHNHQ